MSRGVDGRTSTDESARTRNTVRTWALTVAAIPGLAVSLLAQEAESAPECVDEDHDVVHIASTIVRAAPAVSTVWPGFWSGNQPFFLAEPGEYVLLYSAGEVWPEFAHVRDEGEGAFYAACGTVEELAASRGFMDIEVPLGNQVATAVTLRDDAAATLKFLYHEAFHAYQRQAFPERLSLRESIPTEWVTDAEFRALAEVERRILAAALATDEDRTAMEMATQYLTVRVHRLGLVPEHVALHEAELETIEGTADLAGYTAAMLAMEGSAKRLVEVLRSDLRSPLQDIRFGGGHWKIRVRIYATGASIGALLDRFGRTWREEVECGATLAELLKKEVEFAETPTAGILEPILEEFGYESIYREFSDAPPSSR